MENIVDKTPSTRPVYRLGSADEAAETRVPADPMAETDGLEIPLAVALNTQGVSAEFLPDGMKIIRELSATPIYPTRIGTTTTYGIGTGPTDIRIEASADALRRDFGLGSTVRTVVTWGNFDEKLLRYHIGMFRERGLVGANFRHVLEQVRYVDFQAAYQMQTLSYTFLSFEEMMAAEGMVFKGERLDSYNRSRFLAELALTFVSE